MTYTARAHAKVNLHLEVINKRSDSFHNIFGLNASLDLFDRITFKRLHIFDNPINNISVNIQPQGGEFPEIIRSMPHEDNLITKAIKAYLNRINKSGEIIISIEKNIPAGAGLAGGSSNAAAVLKALNKHFSGENQGLKKNDLLQLGSTIGADVPYCINGGIAICEGIGEKINPIEASLNYWVIIANCGIHVDTALAYKTLKRTCIPRISNADLLKKKQLFIDNIKKGNIDNIKSNFKNDFEEPIFSKYPGILKLKKMISSFKPDYITMTGSGSSVIALFNSREEVELVKKNLSNKVKIFIAKFL